MTRLKSADEHELQRCEDAIAVHLTTLEMIKAEILRCRDNDILEQWRYVTRMIIRQLEAERKKRNELHRKAGGC